VPLIVVWCSTEPAFAQPAPPQSAPGQPTPGQPALAQPSQVQSSPRSAEPATPAEPPEAAYRGTGGFQAKIDAAALALRESDPKLKQYSPKRMQAITEFVVGNMLFVLSHETAHAAITQMGLPVLGRIEDAADTFAALRLIRIGSDFSQRVLTQAAEGWFMADRRDRDTGDRVTFYDEHQLNQQRAYQIVCLMVGSDADKFKDLAAETKLPDERQETCLGDFSNAAYSWDLLLKPHFRSSDQPKTQIDVVYGPAEGRNVHAKQVLSSVGLLETVAGHLADQYAWPSPFTLQMSSCGFPNGRWDLQTHKLTLCYELATDFADLYRNYGPAEAAAKTTAVKRKTVGPAAYKPTQKTRKRR
jgi:Putative metallopeptidase